MGYKVVVAGATGNVGREMLNILAERQFPADEVVALASRRSLGTEVSYGDKTLKTKDIEGFDFTGCDIALFAIGSEPTKKYAPIAASQGWIRDPSLAKADYVGTIDVSADDAKLYLAVPFEWQVNSTAGSFKGNDTAHVRIDIGGAIVTSSITNAAVDDLGLTVGKDAYAVVKASDVMIAID